VSSPCGGLGGSLSPSCGSFGGLLSLPCGGLGGSLFSTHSVVVPPLSVCLWCCNTSLLVGFGIDKIIRVCHER